MVLYDELGNAFVESDVQGRQLILAVAPTNGLPGLLHAIHCLCKRGMQIHASPFVLAKKENVVRQVHLSADHAEELHRLARGLWAPR